MAHIPMEPPVAIANYTAEGLEIWTPVKSPYTTRTDTAAALELDPEMVTVNVTLLGGGFGRKSKADFVTESALVSREVGAPMRVQWTREEALSFVDGSGFARGFLSDVDRSRLEGRRACLRAVHR